MWEGSIAKYDNGTLDNLAISSIEIVEITEDCLTGWGTHQSVDGSSIVAPVVGDGIVEGSSGDDLIDLAYTGDPEGDMIDNGDAINPAHGPDDDLVHAGAGNDTVESGAGDDTIHGGSGDDVLNGGEGNDVIEGDTNAPGGSTAGRQVFEWDKAPDPNGGDPIDDGDDLSGGFSQDTGAVTVDYSVIHEDSGVNTNFSETNQYVGGIEGDGDPVEDNSGLSSLTNGNGNDAGYQLDFSDPVENVSFRINDIDGDGVVKVTAYDANGDPVVVDLDGGSTLTLTDEDAVAGDETATANGDYANADNPNISLLVNIEGPISRLVIEHEQDGGGNSGVIVSDVYFDVPDGTTGIVPGDDTIDGGEGDDLILAGGGDDDVTGGDGADTVDGGDGDDLIDTSRDGLALPDRGFDGYPTSPVPIPPIPADSDTTDDMDVVDGGAGNDTITTGDDADFITGGSGDDSIDGGIDDDTISGGADNDYIVGGEGADSIQGDGGDDTIYGGLDPVYPDGLNIIDDGSGGDPVDPDPTNGRDVIDGGEGNDLIFGQDDDDTLSGGSGDDTLFGGIDEDSLSGGTGNDVLLGGQGADHVSGGDDADIIGAGIGDTIVGGEGGDDNDSVVVSGLATVAYDGGDPSSEAGTITYYDDDLNETGTAEFSEIENVYVVGTASTNSALEDPSSVPGALSVDGVVEGTSGDDLIDLSYTGDPEGDMVDNDDAVLPLVDEQDVIVAGAGNDTVEGHDDSDVIFGGSGDDVLNGMGGNDAIDGGTGDDVLDGGAGRDILVGGDGDDTISGGNDDAADGGDLLYGQDGDDSFINIGQGEVIVGGEDDDGSDEDVLDLTGAAEAANPGGSLSVTYDGGDPASESGVVTFYDDLGNVTGTTEFSEIENVIPCFTPGTLIATPMGERKVEDLKAGDRVITRDNGIQEIRWLGSRDMTSKELTESPHLQPVLIRQGALGNGLPERDIMVSPNHRVLVANDKTALYFEDREVLVAAKHLTGLAGVDDVEISSVTYIHFMFDQHEVVLSDGAWTESFQPGDQTLRGLDSAQRNELLELFPELKTQKGQAAYPSARRSLKKHEARLLVH